MDQKPQRICVDLAGHYWFRIKDLKIDHIIRSNQMILVGIGLCILFWILEPAIHFSVFSKDDFIRVLFATEAHELWTRLTVVSTIIALSLYAQFTTTRRERAEEGLLAYQKQLQSLISELVLTEERERHRLATDLHDSISQVLTIAKLKLEGLGDGASSTSQGKGLDEVRQFIKQAMEQTRALTFELSPPALYLLGLEAAVESLVEQMQQRHGIRLDFEDDGRPKPVTEEFRVLLFRSVHELLVNTVKHAQAAHGRVSIGRQGDHIRINVVDDGVGFDISDVDFSGNGAGGFGLFSIRERLRYLNGSCEITSKLSQGTQVTLMAPLEHEGKTAEGKVT
jgi:signal transduction histidine kinase